MTPLLSLQVEIHLLELQSREITPADLERARAAGVLLATHGDVIEFGGSSTREIATARHARAEVAFGMAVAIVSVPGTRERFMAEGLLE